MEEGQEQIGEMISPNLELVIGGEEQWTATNGKVLSRHVSSFEVRKMHENDDGQKFVFF